MPTPTTPLPPKAEEWRGEDYAQHSSLQAAMADEVLSHLQLRGDEQVLDLGCGDGKLSARIAQRVPRGSVLGVDASPDMVAFAQANFGAGQVPNLRFEVADARALNYRAAFDLLVSFNALHWVSDAATALQGIRQALRPSGQARLRLVTRSDLTSLEEIAELTRQDARWASHFKGFVDPYLRLTAEQYAALAASLGLRVLSLQTRSRRWDFKTEEGFFGFCNAGFGAWTSGLPEDQRLPFVEDVTRRYLETMHATFGDRFTFHFTQTDLALAAKPA